MNRSSLRLTAIVLSLAGLSACGAIQDQTVFQPEFWTVDGGRTENNDAELGLAELAKGNNVLAQAYFERALNQNPQDVHALYGLGVMYQNTGQPTRARQLYEQILALNPRPIDQLMVWADKQTQPIVDLASVNIHLLESGQAATMPTSGMGGGGAMTPMSMTPPVTSMQAQASFGQPVTNAGMGQMPLAGAPPADVAALFQEADLNIVARFETLRALLDQGLITQDEFLVRRKVNAGALLPMTMPPPAAGMDRPVPGADQISDRLRAIGRALEMRALSPAQHTAERSMILDALMPAQPATTANPALPPKGLMEAADSVRRLEMLKNADLITSDEYLKERKAIETAMQPEPMKTTAMAAPKAPAKDEKPKLSGFQPAVHLASYRQKKAAERGWAALKKRFSSSIGDMEYRIERVDLGNRKGVFYRLKVGPLPSNDAAKSLCSKLKAKRQYCEPTTINFG